VNVVIVNKMNRRVAVGDIMTRNVASVSPSANLLNAAKKMVKNRVNSILIEQNKKLIGILTARDILWAIMKKPNLKLNLINVTDIATKRVAVIKPSADIIQALDKMKNFGFRRLPVLLKGELVGIVTLKDILRIDPTLYHQLGELAEVREESEKLQKISIPDSEDWDIEGICEVCDAFSNLIKMDGRMLCSDCKDEIY